MSATRALAIVLGAGLASCAVDVDLGSGPYRCEKTGTCPEGQECNTEGLCVARQGPLPDANPLLCGNQFCTETCSECAEDCGQCIADELLHWSFDEEDGQLVGDASGAGREGSLETASRTVSPRGRALAFDGSGGRAIRPSELDLVRPEVALAAWVRLPQERFASNREVASFGDVYALRIDEFGAPKMFVRQSLDWTAVDTTVVIEDGQWHHILGQKVGLTLQFYVDGAMVAESVLAEEIIFDAIPGRDFVVGFHGDGGNFPMLGDIDDVRVFGRPLSATEVAELAAN